MEKIFHFMANKDNTQTYFPYLKVKKKRSLLLILKNKVNVRKIKGRFRWYPQNAKKKIGMVPPECYHSKQSRSS